MHGRRDWRHQSIQSIIGESPSAHDADLLYLLILSAFVVRVLTPLLLRALGNVDAEGTQHHWDAADGSRLVPNRVSGTNRHFFPDSDHLGVEHARRPPAGLDARARG